MSISRSDRVRLKKTKKERKWKKLLVVFAFIVGLAVIAFGIRHTWMGNAAGTKPLEPSEGTSVTQQPNGDTGKEAQKPAVQPSDSSVSPDRKGSEPTVSLSFVGDVFWASTVWNEMQTKGYDYPYLKVKHLLQKADLAVANLESPITERGQEQKKQYIFRSSPKALPQFKEAGFDIVNLANNHILDFDVQGLLDTFDNLDKAGLKRIGAGRNVKEAYEPLIIEKKGMKIAFLGFSRVVPTHYWKAGEGGKEPGVAHTYTTKIPVESIKKAKGSADIVVVIAHWGKERDDQPLPYQKELAYEYIDAGADLVVGGHPHVLQGFEQYKGKWIAYSLGNFIFTMNPNPLTWESMILEASCTKTGDCGLHVVPILTKLANPEPMTSENADKLYKRLSNISINSIVDPDGFVVKNVKK